MSVADGLDLSTDTGRLVLRIMLSMAEWELDRIRSTWDAARARAIARGMHLAPVPPTGYRYDAQRHLVPDPHDGPVVAEMFALRAEGVSIRDLCLFLEREGVSSPYGSKAWAPNSLEGVLRNRVYRGEVRSGEFVNENAHAPLVDAVAWQAAQRPRPPVRRYAQAEPTILGGLLRCAGCMRVMSSGRAQASKRSHRSYTCGGWSGMGRCPAPARAKGWQAESFVEEVFFSLLRRAPEPAGVDTELAEKLASAERALQTYRDNPTILERLGVEAFTDGLAVRVRRVDDLRLRVAADRARVAASRGRLSASTWERRWPTLTVGERRAAIAELIDCAFITRGTSDIRERIFVLAERHADPPCPCVPITAVGPRSSATCLGRATTRRRSGRMRPSSSTCACSARNVLWARPRAGRAIARGWKLRRRALRRLRRPSHRSCRHRLRSARKLTASSKRACAAAA